jgi:hypothetical protein
MNHLKTIRLSLIACILILTSSCAKIFESPDAQILARKHKIFAVIPPKISIAASRKIDAESIKEQQKTESINFQNEMYSWLLKRKMQGMISQEIQEIETTNAKLIKAGYPETPLTPSEICTLLEVDGIMTSNYSLNKPMSDGAAVATLLLLGGGGATNQVTISLSITDCENKKLIWNYSHKLSGGLGSTPARIVDQLMRASTKKMPYRN